MVLCSRILRGHRDSDPRLGLVPADEKVPRAWNPRAWNPRAWNRQGAGGVNHGIRMGQDGVLDGDTLVAMTGRVYVRCSAENGAITPGDLLTTAALEGHAMRATDGARSFGAVIGKAMSSLDEGTGLVLVLVNLQ